MWYRIGNFVGNVSDFDDNLYIHLTVDKLVRLVKGAINNQIEITVCPANSN